MNPFEDKVTAIDAPACRAVPVVPSDTVDLLEVCRCLYVGGQGTVTVIMAGDKTNTPVPFPGMIGFNPLLVKRVLATNTDATGIIALY